LRRRGAAETEGPGSGLIRHGPLAIEPESAQVLLDGRQLSLTATEYRLLIALARHPGRVFSRRQLLASAWGQPGHGPHRTVDTHVRRLRAKLGPHQTLVETVRGLGYRLRREPEAASPHAPECGGLHPASRR